MQIITITLDFLLFITTSLIFSITILCILLYKRGADKYLRGFLGVLFPLLIQTGLNMLGTYIKRVNLPVLDSGTLYLTYALMATFVSILCSAATLMFLSRYLTTILPIPEKMRTLSFRIINMISLVYLLACLFTVFFINKGDWGSAMNLVLENLFLTGSVLLSAHGITSIIYLKNAKDREQENMLRGIAITFLPLIPFYILDMLFLKGRAFKLTYISYAIFCVHIYLFISRNYFRKYEPNPGSIVPESDKLLKAGFSRREIEIISLVVKGKTNKEIGEELFISINTVKTHIKNIYTKLKITNRVQLINKTMDL